MKVAPTPWCNSKVGFMLNSISGFQSQRTVTQPSAACPSSSRELKLRPVCQISLFDRIIYSRTPSTCRASKEGAYLLTGPQEPVFCKAGTDLAGVANMADALEFDEHELWEESPKGEEATGSAGEEEDASEKEEVGRKCGASSTSSSDSEYDQQLQHNIKAFRGTGASKDTTPIDFGGRSRSRRGSLDEREPVTSRLGTSMPINIPLMSMRRSKSGDTSEQPDKASTFVPPHLLDQPDARAEVSLSSASVAKREKLLQRNAILRRTGFIEAETRLPAGGKGGLPELMDPLNRRMMPIKESHLEASALSAALGSPNSKH